ncbi:MAG: radical SAM protein [Bdellovibrionota bacterium]
MSGQKIAFINPNLVLQKSDPFTTGVVYMPYSLAWFVSSARKAGFDCQVVDAFGEKPNQFWIDKHFVFRGLTPQEVAASVTDASVIVLYAINLTYHMALVGIIRELKKQNPSRPIVVLENTQAVTAYSLRRVQEEFYKLGVDYVITGEAEQRGIQLLQGITEGRSTDDIRSIEGIGFRDGDSTHYTPPKTKIDDLDSLPFPAWDLFPIQNYWKLRYGHGPLSSSKYLPLLTSRGCPYPCRFCVIPETNDVRWRPRSAKNVVDEIEHFKNTYGVTEFHIEDVDPTVKDSRTQELCEEILRRNLKITWKICSGTKVETLKSEKTIELMARAGCRYISVSPESGSPRVLKLIKKPFDIEHAIELIGVMNRVGIRSQACFVLGFPGEEAEDRALTEKMVERLVRGGLDEIAIFIITPVPGSAIFDQFSGYDSYSDLHFSPTWRVDYEELNRFRLALYRKFMLWKLRYHPFRLLKQPFNFLSRHFETKMEMVPYRAFHTVLMMKGLCGNQVHPPVQLGADVVSLPGAPNGRFPTGERSREEMQEMQRSNS